MSADQIPHDSLYVQWGKFKFVLSGRAVYLALVLIASITGLFLMMR